MEQRYNKVRQQLDDYGYKLPLVPDAVPLAEKLLADLIQTTDSLRRYMLIAKELVEERDKLQLGAEPYKCDNAKLVKECNDLHLAFLQFKEQHESTQKDHRRKVALLEKEKHNLTSEIETLRSNLFQVETKLRGCRCPKVVANRLQSKSAISVSSSKSQTKTIPKSKSSTEISPNMAQAQEKINELKNEIKRLQNEQMNSLEAIESLKNQISNRDKEVSRLTEMLQGGRPRDAVNQDCCYKDVDIQMTKMQDEITNLRKSNIELEDKLREAICKQHEAMKRALHLAERNKHLEREMTDIDQMALAVEAECNNTVKTNTTKLNKLQEQLQDTSMQLQSVEREAAELKREKQELMSDLDVMKLEKKHLQNVLETALEEKKRMTDKINRFTRIENDLNTEIDRLVQLTSEQKCKIADLECHLLYGGGDTDYVQISKERTGSPDANKSKKSKRRAKSPRSLKSPTAGKSSEKTNKKKKGRKKKRTTKSPDSYTDSEETSSVEVPNNSPVTSKFNRNTLLNDFEANVCCNPGKCSIHTSRQTTTRIPVSENKEQILCPCCSYRLTTTSKVTSVKEPSLNYVPESYQGKAAPTSTSSKDALGESHRQAQIMEQLIAEKDYYMKEYYKLMDEFKNANIELGIGNLRKQMLECEQQIRQLQHENKSLAQDKHNLMTRLETARDHTDFDAYGITLKSSIKRLERENELLKEDVSKLEEDREVARQKLKVMHDTYVSEKNRYELKLKSIEEELRRLEMDRREWLQSKDSNTTSLKSLEEQRNELHEQLKHCHAELNQQKALYNQLKVLHEQTDKSLSESQNQINQLERELEHSHIKNQELEKSRQTLEKELTNLKSDVFHIRGSMGKIDSEKDTLLLSLDEKTERIANLEVELKAREKLLRNLEEENNDLRRKISSTVHETSSREHILRNIQTDAKAVKEELEASIRSKELAIQENRRLQEELLACTTDCKKCNDELEVARRQIEDLKRQLQTYVAEIKRTEDLISHKEIERSEMLDQFRSLSQEATALENNNHTLEHEATQSRMQLSLALDHANDLERRIESQETLIRSYERQIADMTSQIASLEIQLTGKCKLLEKVESELKATKDLCVKLDEQKDYLMRQISDKQSTTLQVDRDRLHRESISSHDRQTVETLEKLLRECRQENIDQNILNQELQSEINKLKGKIEDLQVKLKDDNHIPEKYRSNNAIKMPETTIPSKIKSKTQSFIRKSATTNDKVSIKYNTGSRTGVLPSLMVFVPESVMNNNEQAKIKNNKEFGSKDELTAIFEIDNISSDSSINSNGAENETEVKTINKSKSKQSNEVKENENEKKSITKSTNTEELTERKCCPCCCCYLTVSKPFSNIPVCTRPHYTCYCGKCCSQKSFDHIRASYSFTKTKTHTCSRKAQDMNRDSNKDLC